MFSGFYISYFTNFETPYAIIAINPPDTVPHAISTNANFNGHPVIIAKFVMSYTPYIINPRNAPYNAAVPKLETFGKTKNAVPSASNT